MYVAATVSVSKAKAKAKMDIHVVDSGFGALGHSSRWLGRACGRARARVRRGSSPPTPQPDEDAFFQEGRSVERDVLKDPPESAFGPGPGQHCVGIGLGRPYEGSLEMPVPVDPDSDSLPSDQSQSQWAILYSYRWQCDQCLLAVVVPGLRFTVMSFLSFGVKETGGYTAGITSEHLSIDRTNERTMGDGRD